MNLSSEFPENVERVVVVTAHPDDVDFGASGTIAKMTASGINVTYCICTDGDAGGFDDAIDRSVIPQIRRVEQVNAASIVGVKDVRFLGYKDGYLDPTHDLQRDIVRVLRQVQPQLVITQTPERNWQRLPATHPDHMAAGEATARALYPAVRNPYAYPELRNQEGLEAWTVSWLWLMGSTETNHWITINETFEQKIAALGAHKSQTEHMTNLQEMIQNWATMLAQQGNLPAGSLAEGFQQIKLPD